MCLPVEGTDHMFPECPAVHLRMASDLPTLEDRFGHTPAAEHLIDGAIHPATIVSTTAAELESGARSVDSVSPRVLSLVHLWNDQKRQARDHESKKRRSEGGQ